MSWQRLNPADHFTLLMDHEIRSSGLAGNYCALVLELDGVPDHAEIRRCCDAFAAHYPRAVARLSSRGRQYAWDESRAHRLPFHVTRVDDADDADDGEHQRALSALINRSDPASESAPFELHLIESSQRSLLLLRWFHPAADAKGAELVLQQLFNDHQVEQSVQEPLQARMRQWGLWRKFRMARKAVGNIRLLDRHASVLPADDETTASSAGDRIEMRLLRFDGGQSEQIMRLAHQSCGMTGTTLYLIGCMMRAIDATGSSVEGDAYCVPYAANLRRRKALLPLFGNQVSFLFAQAGRDQLASRATLFSHLREQHRAAIRAGLDYAMLPLMQAGSWLPLPRYGRVVRESPSGRERSSFWFSYTGDMEPPPEAIAGVPVSGMYQFSQLTAPPGLGLLASSFRGRLSLSLVYVEGLLGPDWIERLVANVSAELLDEVSPA